MVKLIKSPTDGYKYHKKILAVEDSSPGPLYDSTFEKSPFSDENNVLRITLRVFYRQVQPNQLTEPLVRAIAAKLRAPIPSGWQAGIYGDADDAPHFIKDWTMPEWNSFIAAVKTQASLWDSKFWLIPSDQFDLWDVLENSWTNKSGSIRTRQNIKCAFDFEVAPQAAGAHMTIDVVNLLGANDSTFRSHRELYDSHDTEFLENFKIDWNAVTVSTKQPTVAHEIGHALGLPHIGVSRNLGPCKLAVVMGQTFPSWGIPALYIGGENADVCYGTNSTAGDINNIMGAGSEFSKENAQPWFDRLPEHFAAPPISKIKLIHDYYAHWRVSLTEVRPMSIVSLS